ncbi:NAD(P)-dependent oxidoreductase [Candidatus Pacearchaeota archaeon]|nr:NAD(P)-dependent oxidoreductase [Candidatus Pacearchaeota archaeon]
MIDKKTKILITGCGGMLGEAVYNHFKDKCLIFATDIDINEPWLKYLDVTDYKKVEETTKKINPDYIFHLAALTDLEYCEKNMFEAFKVNAMGAENVALVCRRLDIPMVYISTAGVFNGEKEVYFDYDIANPINIYGKSKYGGEMDVKRILKKYFIFRPGWMIGGGPKKDKKFVNKIIKQLQAGTKELFVVDDKMGSPTYTYDLARIIEAVIMKCPYGSYNAVCEGGGTRYDVAKIILEILKLDNKVKIKKIKTEQLKTYVKADFSAPRPNSEKMINIKLKLRGINIPRDWKICLNEYLNKFDWGVS